ncbi:MAG TPA: metalloregulator ArsR/SmtB family transcription factor [Candidatus Binatia bacterium]
MVNYSPDALTPVFAALADPTRRAILERLASGDLCVTELAEPFEISLPAISKHLRVLENAGLLGREKEGRVYHCRLKAEPLKSAADWIAHYRDFWDKQLGALASFLNESMKKEKPTWQRNRPAPTPRYKSEGHSPRHGRKSSQRGRNRKN